MKFECFVECFVLVLPRFPLAATIYLLRAKRATYRETKQMQTVSRIFLGGKDAALCAL